MISSSSILQSVSKLQQLMLEGDQPNLLFEPMIDEIGTLTQSARCQILEVVGTEPLHFVTLAASGRRIDFEAPLAIAGQTVDGTAESILASITDSGLLHSAEAAQLGDLLPDFGHPMILPCRDSATIIGLICIDDELGYLSNLDESDLKLLQPICSLIAQNMLNRRLKKTSETNFSKLESFINSTMHGIIAIDESGTIRNYNKVAEEMFGYSEWEILGNNITTLMDEQLAMAHQSHIDRYISTGETSIIGSLREMEAVRADGEKFPIELGVSEVIVDDGRFFVGAINDLTEQKSAHETLQHQINQAEKAKQDLTRFIESIGHELRTPLNAIVNLSESIHSTADPARHDNYAKVKQVLSSSKHLLHLVNDMFDFKMIESGEFTINERKTDVVALMEDCAEIARAQTEQRKLVLETSISSDIENRIIRTDPARIQQLLNNFLSNAIKYCDANSTITLNLHEADGRIRYSVTNTGEGIPNSMNKHVFEPFDRVGRENSAIEGAGVGLALCKRIADRLGADIGFTSDPGATTTFWVELPTSPQLTPGGRKGSESITESFAPARLLYIEDNPINTMVMEAIVEQKDSVHLTCCSTGSEGVNAAMEQDFDIVLTDINLPDINGYEVLKQIRQTKPEQSVIAVTAAAMEADIARGKAARFSGYITKPIDIGLFWEKIYQLNPKAVTQELFN